MFQRTAKRRLLSDSSDGDDGQQSGAGDAPSSPAAPSSEDPAHPDNIEKNLAFLRDAFPGQDDMVRGTAEGERGGEEREEGEWNNDTVL